MKNTAKDQNIIEMGTISIEAKRSKTISALTGIYINEEIEMFRLEREFAQEIPYTGVHSFNMPK